MTMPHTFRSNHSTKVSLIPSDPKLVKHIRYTSELQYIKFNPIYEISRQATFLLQEFTSPPAYFTKKKKKQQTKSNNKIKKATRPITLPRFSVSVCKELLGPFSELLGLKLLCWSTNSHLPSNCLSRNTTAAKTDLTEIDKSEDV